MFRALSFLPRTRLLVHEVMRSIVAVTWLMVLLATVLLFFAIVFMQANAEKYLFQSISASNATMAGSVSCSSDTIELGTHFGTVLGALIALFQSVTGGVDWYPLYLSMTEVSTFYGFLYIVYIAFVIMSFFNCVTATFVEGAFSTTKRLEREDVAKASDVMEMYFKASNCEEDGMISWENIDALVDVPIVREYVLSLG